MSARPARARLFGLMAIKTSKRILALSAFRAEVLAEAAEWFDRFDTDSAAQLRRMAGETAAGKDAREGETTTAAPCPAFEPGDLCVRCGDAKRWHQPAEPAPMPDFFQPDHVYERTHHGQLLTFAVAHISDAPAGNYRVAFGWRQDPDGGWEPSDSDDLSGWTDITEAGGDRG